MHKIEVQFSRILAKFAVSLFTGEWIEIARCQCRFGGGCPSPSLRGSGLKYFSATLQVVPAECLPLYGGVD